MIREKKFKRTILLFGGFFFVSLLITLTFFFQKPNYSLSPYPNGKKFAFSITDDPDSNTLERIKPVYDYLSEVGLRTTVAVWVYEATRTNGIPDQPYNPWGGDTCERPEYLEYVQGLQEKGFEIASHGASPGNDSREKTISGYRTFNKHFNHYPNIYINHQENLENVYWGRKVAPNRLLGFILGLFIEKAGFPYGGEVKSSKYYWGDILQEKTKYVRLFGTQDINTLKVNPNMPYHDSKRPYVPYWFSFSNGNRPEGFIRLPSKENINRLADERGTCIVYTHFGQAGFTDNGELNGEIKKSIDLVAKRKDGWFVPVSEILDRLLEFKSIELIIEKDYLVILNFNDNIVSDVTLIASANEVFYALDGNKIIANNDGVVIINELPSNNAFILFKKPNEIKWHESKSTEKFKFKNGIFLINNNKNETFNLINTHLNKKIFQCSKEKRMYQKIGEIDLENIEMCFFINEKPFQNMKDTASFIERYKMFFHRTFVYFNEN